MLTLPIKKKWYDMILSGEKKEEYRNITDYYFSRFNNLFDGCETDVKEILFRNGYSASSPSFKAKCTLNVATGREEWGAEKGKTYYVLTIHEIVKGGGKE